MTTNDQIRHGLAQRLNAVARHRDELSEIHGYVWSSLAFHHDFAVVERFDPFIYVVHRLTGNHGVITFQHAPRLYFRFTELSELPCPVDELEDYYW